MGTKYLTVGLAAVIRPMEFIKETSETLVLEDGRKVYKQGPFDVYHDTWEAARDHLIKLAEARVAQHRRSLQLAQSTLGNIRGMKP